MKHTVTIHRGNDITKLQADEGSNLLEFLRENGVVSEAPCGGSGTCGKCAVKVSGLAEAPSEQEVRLLRADRIGKGFRLACANQVSNDLEIYQESAGKAEAVIITEGRHRDIQLEPNVRKMYVELPLPSLEDQRSDLERILDASGLRMSESNTGLLAALPALLRDCGYKVTLVSAGGDLICVEPGDTTAAFFGMSVDIGTTTVASYLYDLNTGKLKAVASMLNPQRKYGADVISRIAFTMESAENGSLMHQAVTGCINELAGKLAGKAGIGTDHIYSSAFAGNTTMMHFLMGLDASAIAAAPFIPVTTARHLMKPGELGITMNQYGVCTLLPGVSGYVGADTVAAVLSSGMFDSGEVSLLVDIGTNGEIVLGSSEWMLSCSTAAGPAFEGANIRNGVGGVTGAIDTVGAAPAFKLTTIGHAEPVGICGSGVIDAVAMMLDAAVIDDTGRLADEDEAEDLPQEIAARLIFIDNGRAFLLAAAKREGGIEIAVTQKDIRELQNAKAAIAAGIETLVSKAGIRMDNVQNVYLAGGFGSTINIGSALRIGLLPGALKGRIEAIGNAAGSGASEGLLSEKQLEQADRIKKHIRYVELSSSPEFVDKYVDNMLFE